MSYIAIHDHVASFPVQVMGEALDVSRDGYYACARHEDAVVAIAVAARPKRTSMAARLLIDGEATGTRDVPDRSLLRLLAQAHQYRSLVLQSDGKSITALAEQAGVSAFYFARILRLAFLVPDLVTAILQGRHSPELTARQLSLHACLPVAGTDQVAALGIR